MSRIMSVTIDGQEYVPKDTEQSSRPFVWTDELVKDFVITYNKIDKLIEGVDPIGRTIQDFKENRTITVLAGKGTAIDVLNTEESPEKKAFNAAKKKETLYQTGWIEYYDGDRCPYYPDKYKTFDDYKQANP